MLTKILLVFTGVATIAWGALSIACIVDQSHARQDCEQRGGHLLHVDETDSNLCAKLSVI